MLDHSYCLEIMGITRWQKIDNSISFNITNYQNSSWIYQTPDNAELAELLHKIMQACKLGKKISEDIIKLPLIDDLDKKLANNVVIIGTQLQQLLDKHITNLSNLVVIPRLIDMQNNQALKKTAWSKLQTIC